jgi:hypothetical protein
MSKKVRSNVIFWLLAEQSVTGDCRWGLRNRGSGQDLQRKMSSRNGSMRVAAARVVQWDQGGSTPLPSGRIWFQGDLVRVISSWQLAEERCRSAGWVRQPSE